ncbi:Uncharacterized conserved protein YbjT, contains NAD(P)-binding and DUF2867 domains [Luteibacter sp. UNCMF331Sha3.1]|uniref:NmrA family NAD(P)-binding protein n=1 Tax=Luteibacter sp. UNCMF331Sha3.1 TaxID=1502760 RepID=UPI0008D5FA48|nr:NmrA family NAD(P)-binding protein [Luteibacter sp. UNCMF331Sha3.1]SEN10851.1 Uncharacterized conserved protein YbjT, contains NAD(P)-binding and DUF2867 domains [Luteibacter sp. UNCMF331Sha3.1]
MTEKPILVTGAAGRIGGVGRLVTGLLLDRGLKVRAQVRVDDERAQHLRDIGAEVVVGDLRDLHATHRAIDGCGTVCFGMSVAETYLEAATNFAVVARHHKVDAFINLSQMTVKEMDIHHSTASPQQRQHWLFEQVLEWSGMPVVEMRPTAFMESLFLMAAGSTAATGKLMAPFGAGKNSAIAAQDVARAIAAVAADPGPHIGRTYHLTGPVSQDMHAIAAGFSAALGRTIEYANVPLEAWKGQLVAMGLAPHALSHVETMARLHQDDRYDRYSADVELLTGTKPMTVETFIRKHAAMFVPRVTPGA